MTPKLVTKQNPTIYIKYFHAYEYKNLLKRQGKNKWMRNEHGYIYW